MAENKDISNLIVVEGEAQEIQTIKGGVLEQLLGNNAGKYSRFVLAILSSIPWVGGVLSGVAGLTAESEQKQVNQLMYLWLKEHQEKMSELGTTIKEMLNRFDELGEEIKERVESEDYLTLVRKTFRSWDKSDTKEKKEMLKKLLMNAGGTKLCSDDLVRLFIDWIDLYHEAHFSVIGAVYNNPSITRGEIWDKIHEGERPLEDSAEADLFKYLIRELSMGGVIRQEREVNYNHQFVKAGSRSRKSSNNVLDSAFEDTKPYELTELGAQFVHYVLNDLVKRIE
jgi:regulator of replication initiation timing